MKRNWALATCTSLATVALLLAVIVIGVVMSDSAEAEPGHR